MSQPPLPAPLAPRPEPGAQLLEAVEQRHSQRSLQLAQQWVHRRGVLDLRRFCSTELNSALGAEAVAWLQELLAFDVPRAASDVDVAATPRQAPLGAPTAANPVLPLVQADATRQADAHPVAATADSEWELESEDLATATDTAAASPRQELPTLDLVLHARAVAAVDEAFVALAKSFREESGALPPSPAVGPTVPAVDAQASALQQQPSAPEPLPVRSGLWPSLRASAASLGSALRPSSGGRNRQAAERSNDAAAAATAELPPISAAVAAKAPAAPAALQPESLTTPEAMVAHDDDQDGSADAAAPAPASTAAQERQAPEDQEHQEQNQEQEISADEASSPAGEAEAPAGKRRLRGRIPARRLPRLSRLRSVMRDCVEETLALLRTPAPEPDEDNIFDVKQPPESDLAVREQPSLSWSLDPFLPPSPSPVGGSDAEAPVSLRQVPTPSSDVSTPAPAIPPAPATAVPSLTTAPSRTAALASEPTRASAPEASATPPPSLSAAAPAARPGQASAARKPSLLSDRPAPAPATLAELRAWLPGRGDLPRAS